MIFCFWLWTERLQIVFMRSYAYQVNEQWTRYIYICQKHMAPFKSYNQYVYTSKYDFCFIAKRGSVRQQSFNVSSYRCNSMIPLLHIFHSKLILGDRTVCNKILRNPCGRISYSVSFIYIHYCQLAVYFLLMVLDLKTDSRRIHSKRNNL
jgi:hypothetical protein